MNTFSISQTHTKQHIITKMPAKCLFIVNFVKLKLLQKAGKLLDISRLGLISNLSATISQNQLWWAVMPALLNLVSKNILTLIQENYMIACKLDQTT